MSPLSNPDSLRSLIHQPGRDANARRLLPISPHSRRESPADPDTAGEVGVLDRPAATVPWLTVVWDDPVNLMSYVTYVFQSYFGFSRGTAERLMLQVHNAGHAIVARGNREAMERHVEAMHGFGLLATLRRADES